MLRWQGAIQAVAVHGTQEHLEPFHLVHQAAPGKGWSLHQMNENAVQDAGRDQENAERERSELGEEKKTEDLTAKKLS